MAYLLLRWGLIYFSDEIAAEKDWGGCGTAFFLDGARARI
jgi:hypothetical protein